MFSSILSAAIQGMEVCPVRVEADVSDGLPSFAMVGYVSSQVKEAQDRVRTALRNIEIALPPKKITVNLAPADIRKEGAGFDLPVAGAILCSLGYIPAEALEKVLMLGELSLNGEVRGVSGVLPIVMAARELGCRCCIIPKENLREGRLVQGIMVVGVNNLTDVIHQFTQNHQPHQEEEPLDFEEEPEYQLDFGDIKGQETVKRAAAVAASGMHNLLLIGEPGSGKTMIARRIPTIMPGLTMEESLEITKIYSIAGLLEQENPVIKIRPFRAPHHTASPQALAGGGRIPKPGEITLAHRGVLFLDELPEFSKSSLEILRQPLENQKINLSRVQGNFTFPANIMLICSLNPCPCGYYPNMNRCTCTPTAINNYLNKISQPLLDRIDLCVEAPAVSYEEMTGKEGGITSIELRKIVTRVHEIQRRRYQGTKLRFNSDLGSREIEEYCPVNNQGRELLEKAFRGQMLTARGYHRIIKVARTIADMEEAEEISQKHVSEALAYRMLDKKYWNR